MHGSSTALRVLATLVFAFLLAPLLVVVLVSFSPTPAFRIPTTEFSLDWYRKFFGMAQFRDGLFLVSLPVALASGSLATLLGTLAAVYLVRSGLASRAAMESFFMLPLLIPSILLGAALYLVAARMGVAGQAWTLVLGHTLLGVPYVIRVVGAGLVAIDPRLEEAAVNLGCTSRQAFLRVVLPLLKPAMFSGAIFAFIVSFSDVNLALFVAGPGTTTLPIHVFSQIFWEGDPTIAAASALQILVVGVLILTMQRLLKLRLSL
ncbi:ABC transporter permease [Elioraea sp.]|uniref:ABC transporter permease n=1 Tax=Elioraea sp. TaxID=2185103 RepID=UPI0025C5286F|nr:ABC transporter permease [Elioraea sp.]